MNAQFLYRCIDGRLFVLFQKNVHHETEWSAPNCQSRLHVISQCHLLYERVVYTAQIEPSSSKRRGFSSITMLRCQNIKPCWNCVYQYSSHYYAYIHRTMERSINNLFVLGNGRFVNGVTVRCVYCSHDGCYPCARRPADNREEGVITESVFKQAVIRGAYRHSCQLPSTSPAFSRENDGDYKPLLILLGTN